MRKITLILITLIISMSLTNADDTTTQTTTDSGNTTSGSTSSTDVDDGDTDEEEVEDSDDDSNKKEEFLKLKREERARIEANREKMKNNREDYRLERGSGVVIKINLTDEQKTKVKEIMDAHKAKMDEYKKAFEAKEITREELIEKVEELRNATNESLKELLGDNQEALRILSLKKVMLDKNMEIRKENGEIRNDFRDQRQALKIKYKDKFAKALGTKLDKFSDEKLNKILEKIEAAIEKTNSNEKLSEINKNKILAQLEALKAIINEKLGVEDEDIDLDIDELIAE